MRKDSRPELVSLIELIIVLFHGQAAVEQNFNLGKSFVTDNITELSIKNKIIKDQMHSNNLTPVSIQLSNDLFSSLRAASVKYENRLDDKNKRKMTSEKESRKTVINEENISVKNTVAGKEKERVVLEKEAFDAMEKSVIVDADMTKVFAKKAVPLKRSCDETNKEIKVLEETLLRLPNCKSLYYIKRT